MVFGAFIDKTLFVCIETFGLLEEEFSMTDIKPFYITILLQAINNMYDAGCSIVLASGEISHLLSGENDQSQSDRNNQCISFSFL